MTDTSTAAAAQESSLSENRATAQPADHDLETAIRADYERCHPDDSFDDLKRRAQFSKEDKGLLRTWLVIAARRRRALSADTPKIAAS